MSASIRRPRSLPFRATREHHSCEAAEDYTELIAELISRNGQARTCQIAEALGISHVTALRTLQRLQREGYVETAPHRPVTLTAKGRKTAHYASERHRTLVRFLIYIGVPEHIAEVDIEGAEHHFSRTSLRAIQRFLSNASTTT